MGSKKHIKITTFHKELRLGVKMASSSSLLSTVLLADMGRERQKEKGAAIGGDKIFVGIVMNCGAKIKLFSCTFNF